MGLYYFMPNGVPNLGQFSAGNPQAQQAVQAAIQARSGQSAPVPQLAQTSQQPATQTPSPVAGAPPGPTTPQAGGVQAPQQAKPPATEAELIIKGLTQRLSAISKVETAQVSPAF